MASFTEPCRNDSRSCLSAYPSAIMTSPQLTFLFLLPSYYPSRFPLLVSAAILSLLLLPGAIKYTYWAATKLSLPHPI